jgi:hypothetical protein
MVDGRVLEPQLLFQQTHLSFSVLLKQVVYMHNRVIELASASYCRTFDELKFVIPKAAREVSRCGYMYKEWSTKRFRNANSRLECSTPSSLFLLRPGQAFRRIRHAGEWSKLSTLLLLLVLILLILFALLAFCIVGMQD